MSHNDPLTSTHWGTYRVQTKDGQITALRGFETDPDPSPIGNGIVDVLDGPTRIKTPMVRESWLRHGAISRAAKINGREPVLLHPDNAAQRGISPGDLLRVFNDRGACLAVAVLIDDIRPDVVQISTGAWLGFEWQADGTMACRHGNPNVLTRDKGTSRLALGPVAHSCLVDVERFQGDPPSARAFDPPRISDG